MLEDKMVGWHHQLNGHEFGQTSVDSEGQGSLACCSSWHHKESDMTEWQKQNLNPGHVTPKLVLLINILFSSSHVWM